MIDIQTIEKDDLMAVVHFVKVDRVYAQSLLVTDVDNQHVFDVIGQSLVEAMASADRYGETKKVSRTEMAEILSESFNTPFKVVFEKADGTLRSLRGRLIKTERLMGRCMVEDLDKPKGKNIRQVDNRTLASLIVGGVFYTLKK